jgi:hypothetical protein
MLYTGKAVGLASSMGILGLESISCNGVELIVLASKYASHRSAGCPKWMVFPTSPPLLLSSQHTQHNFV